MGYGLGRSPFFVWASTGASVWYGLELYVLCPKLIRQRKKNFFMQNSGLIKISTIHSFKGHESPTVFCILQEHDNPELVYTAMTRAKKNLIIFDSINSHYSSFFEKLLS